MSRYTKLSNEKRNGIVYTPKEMAMYLSKRENKNCGGSG